MQNFKQVAIAFALVAVVVLMTLIPISVALRSQNEKKNFRTVREGVFYRSGQMSVPGLARTVHDYSIRSVITLRDSEKPGVPPPDKEEEIWCQESGLNFFRFKPMAWEGQNGSPAPVEANVSRYLEALAKPSNYPILLHCFAGIHRTGTYTAIYRMEIENWPLEKALEEMKACGYANLENDQDLHGYISHYKSGERQKGLPRLITRNSWLAPSVGLTNVFYP